MTDKTKKRIPWWLVVLCLSAWAKLSKFGDGLVLDGGARFAAESVAPLRLGFSRGAPDCWRWVSVGTTGDAVLVQPDSCKGIKLGWRPDMLKWATRD